VARGRRKKKGTTGGGEGGGGGGGGVGGGGGPLFEKVFPLQEFLSEPEKKSSGAPDIGGIAEKLEENSSYFASSRGSSRKSKNRD